MMIDEIYSKIEGPVKDVGECREKTTEEGEG